MYALRKMSVNGIQLEDEPFQKEIEIEALLIDQPDLMKPPDADEDTPIDMGSIVSQIVVPGGGRGGQSNGRIDIAFKYIRKDLKPCWAVVEIKNEELTCVHYQQLQSYLNQWNDLYNNILSKQREDSRPDDEDAEDDRFNIDDADAQNPPCVIGILVGTSVKDDLACHILDQCKPCEDANGNPNVDIGAIEVARKRGIVDANRYVFTASVFKNTTTTKARYKFHIPGTTKWCSGRGIVWEIIDYLAKKGMPLGPPPSGIQNSHGTFPVVENTLVNPNTYFRSPITTGSGSYYVTNQWAYVHGTGNLGRFFREVANYVAKAGIPLTVEERNPAGVVRRII